MRNRINFKGITIGHTCSWSGDVVALGILGITALIAGGVAIYEYTTAKSKVRTKEEEEALAIARTKPNEFTFIYRKGSGNATNLTPREIDTSGLSYSLTPPVGQPYTVTTIEAVNSTGVLVATIDGPNHVSVRPVSISELPMWIASRPTAKEKPYYLTTVLVSISFIIRGGSCDVISD